MPKQTVPSPKPQPHSARYAERIPLSENAKAGGTDVPMPDGNRTSLQQRCDVGVPTVSNRNVPDPQK